MSGKNTHSDGKKSKLLPWATTIMLVVGVAVLAAVYWNRNVTVDELSFSGNVITEIEVLTEAANVEFGVHPDSLDLSAIVQRIEKVDYVKSATPYIEPNGDLNIEIKERTPVALLIKD